MADEPEKSRYTQPSTRPPSAWPLTLGCTGLLLLSLGSLGGCMTFARGDELQFYLEYSYLVEETQAGLWYPDQVGIVPFALILFVGCAFLGLAWLTRERTFSLRRMMLTVLVVGALGALAFLLDDLRPRIANVVVLLKPDLAAQDEAELRARL